MGIRFVLMVNKQGQTRLAQYYEYLNIEERRALEGEIVRKCLTRNEQQCSFVEHRNYKVVYRRYASLFFLVGVDNEELCDVDDVKAPNVVTTIDGIMKHHLKLHI
ncbi:hypothetical protein SASPL_109814 [Salvia splendens]|uniref:AP complex mu/sigma subunit domain-containing protein n=1 Tax=Salvia splendens TaxID=180675 RepID=A0A8X8YKR7_SALSN|nr:hypothetical protein SASPL_109814 [Salvia splendens]